MENYGYFIYALEETDKQENYGIYNYKIIG